MLARWLLWSSCGGHWASLSHFRKWRVDPVFSESLLSQNRRLCSLCRRDRRGKRVVVAKDCVVLVLRSYVSPRKEPRSTLGLLNHLASLLFSLRLFLSITRAASFDPAVAPLFVRPSRCVRVSRSDTHCVNQGLHGPRTDEIRTHVHPSGLPEP